MNKEKALRRELDSLLQKKENFILGQGNPLSPEDEEKMEEIEIKLKFFTAPNDRDLQKIEDTLEDGGFENLWIDPEDFLGVSIKIKKLLIISAIFFNN